MITESIDRFAQLGVWVPAVHDFLHRPSTIRWLIECQQETGKSDDEIVLLLLAAMRAIDLTVLDGAYGPHDLGRFLEDNEASIHGLCQTHRVQANVAERALPILELLGERWGRQKLFVTELGSSFGLIGRVLVSATKTLQNFERYFTATQQRPTAVPLVAGYLGIDLAPPDERWLLACIPLADLRTRVARFIYEVPAGPHCFVTQGSAFDRDTWPRAPDGTLPVILTSFMLYQLPPADRQALATTIRDHVRSVGGTWLNLDVLVHEGQSRFVVQEDGRDKITLENDLCVRWQHYES